MKRYYAAAGALLLGTSALAWAGDTDKTVVEPFKVATSTETGMSWDKSTLATKSDTAIFDESLSSLDKDLAKLAVAETDHKIQTASTDSWSDTKVETASFDTAKLETASLDDTKLDTAWSDTGKVQTASVAGDSKTAVLSTDESGTGMGGPLEEVDTASTSAVVQPSNANPEHDARGIPVISDVAFVPTGFNGAGGAVGGPVDGGDDESYAACTSERTDNCIQLYERGVRATLASGESKTAMGGPYEPVDVDSTELAMNGDGDVQVSKGETADTGTVAVPTDAVVATHSEYQGVGGPVEAQSGYPPCSPGPGDDRCIQLYESGVSGAGN